MMQSCASAAKLRGGGPILCYGVISHGVHRVTATSNRHRRPVTSGRTGPKLSGAFSNLRSLRRAQNDAVRYYALSHEPPQGDQKLARQGSLLVIDRTRNIAQQLGFAQVELAFDMTAAFVDQFAAFELAENVLTLGIDE
jgi:hypothetical protein